MKELGEVAPHLANPLVLCGLVLSLLFGLYRVLIRSGVIQPLRPPQGAKILRQILQHGFALSLIVILLGFGLAAWKDSAEKEEAHALARQRYLKPKLVSYLKQLDDIESDWPHAYLQVQPIAERTVSLLKEDYPNSAQTIDKANRSAKEANVIADVTRKEIQKVIDRLD